jgi:hypothetical protein
MATTVAPVTQNLVLTQGDSWSTSLLFTDPAGDPLDLAGWTFSGQVRRDVADRAPDVEAEMVVAVDAAAGLVGLSLSVEQTLALGGLSVLRYDVKSSDGTRRVTWLAGLVAVRQEVTRAVA